MAEALGVAASVLGFVDYTSAILRKISSTFPDEEVFDRLLICQKILERGLEVLPRLEPHGQSHEILQVSARHTIRIVPQVEKLIQKRQKLRVSGRKGEITLRLDELEYWCKIFNEEINHLQMAELHKIMGGQLYVPYYSPQPRTPERTAAEDMPSSLSCENLQSRSDAMRPTEPIIRTAGASSSTFKPSAMTYSVPPDLEGASRRLYEYSEISPGRAFLFPFVIVPDEPGVLASTPFQVKLDSGCEQNWISSRVLKRAQVEGNKEDIKSAKAWLGFNGQSDLIVPKATITLTWYSVNAAYTHRHEFLVHDDVPFDVVLGSDFIIEEGWKKSFNDPNLALRYSGLSDEQLEKIHQKARHSKEEAEGQIQTERAMKAKDREMRRRLNLSRTGTPRSSLTPHDVLSRRSSIRTLPYAPNLALSGVTSQQTQSMSGTETEAAERQDTHSTRSKQSDSQNPQSHAFAQSTSAETEPDQGSIAGHQSCA
ncbi:hypothetical protein F52700_3603 [Fusarium sp. NRRL 52700]|nr:hypothetical protein F52700_3603 [Fusarium sp. NRRL 52700]